MQGEYMNLITLQGFIASDLVLQPTSNGGQRCYFDVKVETDGRKKVEYIPVTLWNAAAAQFVEKFKKGDNVLISGELTRNSTPDGRKYLVISCNNIKLIVAASRDDSLSGQLSFA